MQLPLVFGLHVALLVTLMSLGVFGVCALHAFRACYASFASVLAAATASVVPLAWYLSRWHLKLCVAPQYVPSIAEFALLSALM